MERLQSDVVVVGAGLAGLVCARELVAGGASVIVLEARDRVGGRLLNEDLGGGGVVEVGGQWIGPTQDRIGALAAELGVRTFPTHAEGASLLELGDRLRRYSGTIPRLGPVSLADLALVRRRIEREAARVVAEAPWLTPRATELDGQTFASWLRRHARSRTARLLFRLAGRTIWGAEPEEMSLLHVLFYVRSAGGLNPLLDVHGGAQQDRLVGGSQLIALRLATELGERVRLGAAVRALATGGGGVRAEADAATATARRAVVAIPPPLRARISFEPALPPQTAQLSQRMAQGRLAKFAAVYEEPFWRDEGLSGEAVSDRGPATLTFDNSPPDGRPGILLGFVGGDDARRLGELPAQERRAAVTAGFERIFGRRAGHPERVVERDWGREQWSGGGPTCYLPPWGWVAHGAALRRPVGPIHWAGTETATRWAGFMDGAVRSGERAAAEVLDSL